MKQLALFIGIVITINSKGQDIKNNSDTIKCYVQIMVPASGTVGLSKEIEDNREFLNGGIILYTKAYAIKDGTGMYVKFLTPKRKPLKMIWKPNAPQVMEYEW